jgi:putative aminopeptidase FrvX
MQKASLEFLREIMELPSPSGFEQRVQRVVRKRMKAFADEVKTDVHGNVIGSVNPGAKLRVMLAGHADEIGLMITHIDNEGFLYFASIGGVDANLMPGLRIEIHAGGGRIIGVIGKKPIHMMSAKERGQAVKIHNLWIDIGAKNKKDAEKVVAVGDIATVVSTFEMLRNDIAVSRGFDDRIGAFIVTEALAAVAKKNPKVAVLAV